MKALTIFVRIRLWCFSLLCLLPDSAARARDALAADYPWSVPKVEGITLPGLPPVSARIHVDQFGYLPDESKVAVISDPQEGYNAAEQYHPGARLELRRVDNGDVVHHGAPRPFREGAIDPASGDRGWWYDFSAVTVGGDYYVFDPAQGRRSHVFRIAADVYRDVLRAAMRMFYYQRLGFAHQAPHAEQPWLDGPKYLQDQAARSVLARNDPASARDLGGGWMDAGDTNKYPTFLPEVIHPLLHAWREHSRAFGDDFGIPESGNGLPDLLDEVKWELDWLIKMQEADGGVYLKMGHITYEGGAWPLSQDNRPRYYGPKSSAATLATAGLLAHAARVYERFPAWRSYAAELAARADRAWAWYRLHPREYELDDGTIRSGDADRDAAGHDRWEAVAAFHLWALTKQESYHDVFRRQHGNMLQMLANAWSPYEAGSAECLLDYARQPEADQEIARRIRDRLRTATTLPEFMPQDETADLYRAWMPSSAYHWGSNRVAGGYGTIALGALLYLENGVDRVRLRQRALDLLHWLHGMNPVGMVYLTNMGESGAELSAMRIYHEWFAHGSPLASRPAPGFVTGGPNRNYTGAPAWLGAQPDAKSYADFNVVNPERSWEITEPAIYYQAMYVRMLAAFVASSGAAGDSSGGPDAN